MSVIARTWVTIASSAALTEEDWSLSSYTWAIGGMCTGANGVNQGSPSYVAKPSASSRVQET